MTTEQTNTPTIEGVLAQLMREAEWLAGNVVDMSESAEPHDHFNPSTDPEEVLVSFEEMGDVRYKGKRVLMLLNKIRETFPEQTKHVSIWCATCDVHTDHNKDEHGALVVASAPAS